MYPWAQAKFLIATSDGVFAIAEGLDFCVPLIFAAVLATLGQVYKGSLLRISALNV